MKIIYFSAHPNLNLNVSSGPGTHMREVIHAFEEAGHEVIPCIMGGIESTKNKHSESTGKHKDWKATLKDFLPNIIWQSLKDLNLLRFDSYAKQELENLIQKEKPDLIYERAYYMMTAGVDAAKKHGVKHFIEINAPYPEEKAEMEGRSFFKFLANKKERQQVALSQKVFVVSTALKNYLTDRTPCKAEKIMVTPNAINPTYIHADIEKQNALRALYGLKQNAFVFGFVGSIFPYHGVKELIEAFALLDHKDKMLLIVGDGAQLPSLKTLSQKRGLANQIKFIGSVPHQEVYNHIALMDCCVMARSNWYGSPVKIFEYGALNKMVIAPDNGPVNDVMQHGVHGHLISENQDLLVQTLRLVVAESEKNKTMAQEWHNKVLREHTWAQVGKIILSQV